MIHDIWNDHFWGENFVENRCDRKDTLVLCACKNVDKSYSTVVPLAIWCSCTCRLYALVK